MLNFKNKYRIFLNNFKHCSLEKKYIVNFLVFMVMEKSALSLQVKRYTLSPPRRLNMDHGFMKYIIRNQVDRFSYSLS